LKKVPLEPSKTSIKSRANSCPALFVKNHIFRTPPAKEVGVELEAGKKTSASEYG
jgi:hypothetical protein